jgi:hypothetical protein
MVVGRRESSGAVWLVVCRKGSVCRASASVKQSWKSKMASTAAEIASVDIHMQNCSSDLHEDQPLDPDERAPSSQREDSDDELPFEKLYIKYKGNIGNVATETRSEGTDDKGVPEIEAPVAPSARSTIAYSNMMEHPVNVLTNPNPHRVRANMVCLLLPVLALLPICLCDAN